MSESFLAGAQITIADLKSRLAELNAEYEQAVQDWAENDEQMLADNARLADRVTELERKLARIRALCDEGV